MSLGVACVRDVESRLSALAGSTTRPEDALEPALRILMQAGSASAGAICLYDPTERCLRLASEVGLSDDGCRRLRCLRNDPAGWTLPLQCVLERRMHVLNHGSQTPLPSLVDPAESIGAIACLPLEADGQPIACVILIALSPWVLDHEALRAIVPALSDLAAILRTIGRHPREATAAAAPPPLLAADELPAEEEDLLGAREALERAHAAEVTHLTGRLSDVERAWAREHSLRVEQEHRHEQQRERSEREREAAVRRALALAEAAEAGRAEAATEAQRLRSELAEAQRLGLETREQLRRARAGAEAAESAARAATDERARLVAAAEELRVREGETAARLSAVEAALAALRTREGETVRRAAEAAARRDAMLAEAEQSVDHERKRAAALETERSQVGSRLDEATAAVARLRAELETVVQRGAADRGETLRQALEIKEGAEAARAAAVAELEAVRAAFAEAQRRILEAEDRAGAEHVSMLREAGEAVRRADEARAAAVAEMESARNALAAAQADALAAHAEVQRTRREAERTAVERDAARADAERLGCALAEASAQLAAPSVQVGQLESEVRELQERCRLVEAAAHEREITTEADARARLDEIQAAFASERGRVTELERELAVRAEKLADASRREQQARELLTVVTEDRDGVLDQATAMASAAEEARAAAAAETEAIRGALANAQGMILEAEETASRARDEAERAAAALQASQAEGAELRASLQEVRGRLAEREPGAHAVAARGGAAATRVAPPASSVPRPSGPLVFVDASGTFGTTATDVHVLAPDDGLVPRLAELDPAWVLVNLAGAGGLAAAAALSEGGHRGTVWGCLVTPDGTGAVSLGPIEITPRPLDPDAVLAVLARHAARGARVLAVGDAAQSLISLRQALAREGMSVSIAWDAKQARDLMAMVRPEVAIVDLALPSNGGHRVVAELAAGARPPLLVIVPGESDDSAAFAAVLAERARLGGVLSPTGLLQLVRGQRASGTP